LGWVPSTAFAVISLLAPLAPVLLAYMDRRVIIAGAGTLSAVFFFIASQMSSVGALIALVAIAYIGCALTLTTGCISVAMATNKWRPIATGIGNIGSPVAGLILPRILLAAQGNTSSENWHIGFMTIGGLYFLIPVISIFMRPPKPEKTVDQNANETPEAPSRLRFCRGAVDFSVFRQKVFLLILLYMALHFGAMTTAYVFAAPYIDTNVAETKLVNNGTKIANCTECPLVSLTEEEGGEPRAVSVLNIMAGGDLTGMIFYSLCMNIPLEAVSSNRFLFFIVNEIINIVATSTIKLSNTFSTAATAFFFMGFHYGGWFVIFWTVIADMFGKDMGHASSWALAMGGLSGLATPNILTSIMSSRQLSEKTNSLDFTVVWYGMAICQSAALLVLVVIVIVRSRQRASVDYTKAQANA